MNLSDHLRPLLRDHDCVIIPDFGGLVAESVPAQVQPGGRHLLSPPTRQVAFNQALTRNDGLLVDALREHLGLPAAEAREALRQAVATLHHELQNQQRTELPGIGVFRQQPGRGLQFEYTGTDNLLAAAFGLPELTAHPVAVLDARLAREQQAQLVPRLRSAGRGLRLRRLVPGATIGLLAGLAVAGLYLLNLHPENVPTAWQGYLPRWEETARPVALQAALVQPSFTAPTIELAEPAAVIITSAAKAPAAATVAAPQAAVPAAAPGQTADPVEALLSRGRTSPLRPRAKAGKVPAAAAIALADESNVAKPVPMALRKAGTGSALTTSYAAAATAPRPAPAVVAATPAAIAPAPVAHPVVSVKNSKAVAVVAPKAMVAHAAKPAAMVAHVTAPQAVTAHAVASTLVVAHPAAPAPVVAAAALAPAGVAVPTTIKARTGRYYLIVAAYSSFARAEEGRRNLAHAGRPAKVICPPAGSRLYRLSAVDFADRPTATVAAAHLRQNPHFDKGLTVLPY